MRSFIYRTGVKLTCECDGSVILCVTAGLLASGGTTLTTTLTNITTSSDCNGNELYNYYLDYDENLLTDPTYILNSFDITGLFCRGCLVQYIEEYVQQLIGGA